MFEVLIDHFFCNIASGPCTVTNCPEMSSPIALLKMGELLLEFTRGSPFALFHYIADGNSGGKLHVHMDMISTDYSFEDDDIFCITDLDEKLSATFLYISREYLVTILCSPDNVDCQTGNRVAAMSIGIRHSS